MDKRSILVIDDKKTDINYSQIYRHSRQQRACRGKRVLCPRVREVLYA